MTSDPDTWVYGDYAPDLSSKNLPGFKARWLVEQLPDGATLRVLDYGAGEGKHLHLIRGHKPGSRLVGVDIRSPHTTPDFEFHRVDSREALPFPDGAFDVVVSCDVLEHVEDIDASLNEIRRVLRPGGAFIGFVPAEGGLGLHGFFRWIDPHIYLDTKDHRWAYTRRELVGKLADRFNVVRLAYSYHLMGASLDAAFFASFKAPVLGPRMEGFWRGQENDVYRARCPEGGRRRPSLLSRMVRAANWVAYYESVLLQSMPFGAKGLHFHVRKF